MARHGNTRQAELQQSDLLMDWRIVLCRNRTGNIMQSARMAAQARRRIIINQHPTIRMLIAGLLAVLASTGIVAQGAEDSREGLMAKGWRVVIPEAEGAASEPRYVVFLTLNDGEMMLEVGGGADVIWIRSEDDEAIYSGSPLVTVEGIDSEASLELIDEETRSVTSVTRTGVLSLESEVATIRTDIVFEIWVEASRELTEYSMFGPCLGVELRDPPRTFSRRDLILPVAVDDVAGTLTVGRVILTGGDGAYERIEESPFGTFTQVITHTALLSEEMIALTYQAIANDRDDCEVTYEATYIPFDGDFDALFEAAVALVED